MCINYKFSDLYSDIYFSFPLLTFLISFFFFPFRCTKIHFHIFSRHLCSSYDPYFKMKVPSKPFNVFTMYFQQLLFFPPFTGILSAQVITVNYASKRRTCERFSIFPLSRSVAIVSLLSSLMIYSQWSFIHEEFFISLSRVYIYIYLHQMQRIIDFVLTSFATGLWFNMLCEN